MHTFLDSSNWDGAVNQKFQYKTSRSWTSKKRIAIKSKKKKKKKARNNPWFFFPVRVSAVSAAMTTTKSDVVFGFRIFVLFLLRFLSYTCTVRGRFLISLRTRAYDEGISWAFLSCRTTRINCDCGTDGRVRKKSLEFCRLQRVKLKITFSSSTSVDYRIKVISGRFSRDWVNYFSRSNLDPVAWYLKHRVKEN